MEKIMILNGSPRAPRSNSKQYAALFAKYSRFSTETFSVTGPKSKEIGNRIQEFSHVLLVFPLYADGIPVPLLLFLKEWEQNGFKGNRLGDCNSLYPGSSGGSNFCFSRLLDVSGCAGTDPH